MAVAKVDWTMPSLDGWDNSNMAMYSGDFEIMGRVERAHIRISSKIEVQKNRHGRVWACFQRGRL